MDIINELAGTLKDIATGKVVNVKPRNNFGNMPFNDGSLLEQMKVKAQDDDEFGNYEGTPTDYQ